MEKLLNIRLGKCKGRPSASVGFAAAGATADSGRLIDITNIYINTGSDEIKPFHSDYMSESVLSTTLPIITACRNYHSLVYMTSRRFAYSDLCIGSLRRLRQDRQNTTVIIGRDDGMYIVHSGDSTDILGEAGMIEVAKRELARPMSCAICDWNSVPVFCFMSMNIEAGIWWYPMKIESPLESTVAGQSSSYFARAYGEADGHCIMVGGYRMLRRAPTHTAKYIGERWNAYNTLLQSQTCGGGECFSCSYLRSCLSGHIESGKSTNVAELDLLLDV